MSVNCLHIFSQNTRAPARACLHVCIHPVFHTRVRVAYLFIFIHWNVCFLAEYYLTEINNPNIKQLKIFKLKRNVDRDGIRNVKLAIK